MNGTISPTCHQYISAQLLHPLEDIVLSSVRLFPTQLQRNIIYTDIEPADSVRLASWKKQLGDIQVKNNNQFRLVEISISSSQDQVDITAQDLSLIG